MLAGCCAGICREIERLCDWSTLRLERDAFSTEALGSEFADLLFSVQLKGSQTRQRIRLLFEHKRRPERGLLRQLLGYIYQQVAQTPATDALPCVITLLLLQQGRCHHANLASEYRLPDDTLAVLAPFLLDFRLIPIELGQLQEAELLGTAGGRFALAMLKSIGAGKPTAWLDFENILRELCSHLSDQEIDRELRRAFVYLTSSIEPNKEQEVRDALVSAKAEFEPVKEHVMSLLEHLEERGAARGRQEGRQEGRVLLLTELLHECMPGFTDRDAACLARLSASKLLEIQAAFADRSWDTVRKLLRSASARRNTAPSRSRSDAD